MTYWVLTRNEGFAEGVSQCKATSESATSSDVKPSFHSYDFRLEGIDPDAKPYRHATFPLRPEVTFTTSDILHIVTHDVPSS